MHSKHVMSGVVATLVLLAVFYLGVVVGERRVPAIGQVQELSGTETGMPEGVDFSPFWKTWNTLDEKFVSTTGTTTSAQERVWGAISGLVDSLGDPYTTFFSPAESAFFEEEITGNFAGVGMEIGEREGVLVIIAPLKNSPAERAGIRSGDAVIQINGMSAAELTVDEAVTHIRGELGTEVTLTLLREGRVTPFDVTIIREIIHIPTIETGARQDGIFVIRLFNFNATAPDDFRQALREFVLSGDKKLILDVRANPGGFLDGAISIASWFLPAGKVVVYESFDGKGVERETRRSRGYNIFSDELQMIVLIDRGSASASEILAGALREHGVARLVGTQTFGKGSVQELIKITPETSLKVTVAEWLTPDGQSISDGGLEPDVVVERTLDDVEQGRDPQMDMAVRLLLAQ
ncbi:S41 family peptidase [Candidatus Wolfebacteria bacterium]|nr:S41 family peptidase [Candidatus Wolfebacteria bacterium]